MNILIINGSPRIHGNISAMLDAIREEAEQRGAEVTTVLASRLQVKPCYWGNMPGQLKIIFDRIVYGMIGEDTRGLPLPLHKGKKAILISTSTTPFPFNILFGQSRGAIKAMREILKWSGFKVVSAIELGGTRQHPAGEKVLNRCRKAIKKCM